MVSTRQELLEKYPSIRFANGRLELDPKDVPEKFHPYMGYASLWGIADHGYQNDLIRQASDEAKKDLVAVVRKILVELDEWLAGPEADGDSFTDSYVAFAALTLVATSTEFW